jgi:hypothetical protein
MRDAPGDGYREIADWPTPGDKREPGQLALLAIDWIAMNRGFIKAQVPAEAGFDHREVTSLLMWRALNGGGLTPVLQAHADGTAPIASPKGLLLKHVYWAAGEYRSSARARRETATDWADPAAPAAPPATDDPDGNPNGYTELVSILSAECQDVIARQAPAGAHDQVRAVQHVTNRLPALWAVFCRYAPEPVSAQVAALDDDSRACILLGIWPGDLPHRAIATYRQLAKPAGCGAVTVAATQRKISRLRDRLRLMWPPELLPPGLRSARYPLDGDTDREEGS